MLLDVEEDAGGGFRLWGVTPASASASASAAPPLLHSVCIRAFGFQPYFFLPCPLVAVEDPEEPDRDPAPAEVAELQRLLNCHLAPDLRVEHLEALTATPIMFFRPAHPHGGPYLRVTLRPGAPVRRAAAAVEKLAAEGVLGPKGYSWRERGVAVYEADVKPLSRFLCDSGLSGVSWVFLPPCTCALAAPAGTPGASSGGGGGGERCALVPPGARVTRCDLEVRAPWRALVALTPDATEIADPAWRPPPFALLDGGGGGGGFGGDGALSEALAAAREGAIAPLRIVTLEVLAAPADGADRTPNPARDPVVCIAAALSRHGAAGAGARPVVFLLAGGPASTRLGSMVQAEGMELRLAPSEAQLLLGFRDWLIETDPDALATFQVRDSLGALVQRFQALRLDGGALHLSRLARGNSRALATKSIVMYSAAWVKSQSRMASTSNQETFKTEGLHGRLVFDVLRQVLTSQSLATFTLVDCVASLLGETLEVLPGYQLARLQAALASASAASPAGASRDGGGSGGGAAAADALAAGLRLGRYALRRVTAVAALMERLATVPETYEMARATGLTIDQVLYNAQMVRTLSLLLRVARRRGVVLGGRGDAKQLTESPHLMHPVERKTAGLYRAPVATLDFASLYPSLYRAHNLCYTTLVHPGDVDAVGRENCTFTPTGAAFVKPGVREGILPYILAALMDARAATRAALAGAGDPATRAVLDGRQRALKLTANALYGFTGAQASPLQCVELADSCLSLGAHACRGAIERITVAIHEGELGAAAAGGKVIYAQTDSVFISFPAASAQDAAALGRAAAALVTQGLPSPMELKYERVMCPFLLLHVNRYAGRALDGGPPKLVVKGVKAIWRQSAPIVQSVLQGSLHRILMEEDVPGAVAWAEQQIRRLLSGRVGVWELAMTGGLWRVTGAQVEQAAAQGGAGEASAASEGEDLRGPHVALAVRLAQRDPGRGFVLGERVPYVLLAGARTQDDAAEDPLAAARAGQVPPDYQLYWNNKLRPPLTEIFATCLPPEQLRALLHGPHTQARPPVSSDAPTAAARELLQQQQGSATPQAAYGLLTAPPPPPAPTASTASTQQAAAAPGAKKGPRSAAHGIGGAGGQVGMKAFFKQAPQCLGCRRVLPPSDGGGGAGPRALPPALCADCRKEEGKWAAVYVACQAQEGEAVQEWAAVEAACRGCHSGGHLGVVACENGECPAMYGRISAPRRAADAEYKLRRLDLSW